LSFSRTSIAVACIAGLIALPGAAGAQKKPRTALSHVIKTPKGNQLAVPITVRYRLQGKSLDGSILTTRVAIAARLPGGRVLRAVERRTVPGKARVEVEHHPFFSVRETRVLRRALAGSRPVKLAVASSLRADLGGDGDTDARSSRNSTQILDEPSGERSPAPVEHQQGDDPCGVIGQPAATCTNVTGATFTARHFWDSARVRIACPRAFPYTTGSVSTKTTSTRYSLTVTRPGTGGGRTDVTIIDDDVRGHPFAYTPTVACTTSRG